MKCYNLQLRFSQTDETLNNVLHHVIHMELLACNISQARNESKRIIEQLEHHYKQKIRDVCLSECLTVFE